MFNHYIKTAWRNLLRNKVNSFIHISGLGIGITCALLIGIFIKNELAYDKFHKDGDRIYQVVLNSMNDGREDWNGNTPPPLGAALEANIPEIESYTRFYKVSDAVVRSKAGTGDRFYTEKNLLAVDSNFLQLFDFGLVEGDRATALLNSGSIVMTQTMAKKYFGSGQALGKTVLIGQSRKPFLVTAVLRDLPSQSSIQFDMLMPMADQAMVKRFSWSWVWRQMVCYVKLKPSIHGKEAIANIEAKFPAVIRVQGASGFKRLGTTYDEFVKKSGKWDFHLQPLSDIHLYSSHMTMPWLSNVGNIQYIYIFGSVAIFIILLACINFMTLSTARAARRAKEVGVRKVAGSSRSQLIRQFLAEAFLYTLLSTFLAIVITLIFKKPFLALTGLTMDNFPIFTAGVWVLLAILILSVTLLAGSYPAFYLTSFQPAAVLKGKNTASTGRRGLWIRNGLVVFQFAVSTFMIVGTVAILKQLNFFRKADLGFSRDNVVVISNTNRLGESEESFRQSVAQLPGVKGASLTTSIPSGFLFGDGYEPKPSGNEQTMEEIGLTSYIVDEDFVPTLQLTVLKGRNFSKDFADSGSVILNEEAAKQIGWADPVGKWIQYPGGNNALFQVVGVVKDFNVESMHSPIVPFALFHFSSKTYDLGVTHMVIKLDDTNIGNSIAQLEKKWRAFSASEPFDYSFLDATFDAQYRSEQRMGKVFGWFAALSIFIACLGLFGLCAYIAERRTKEISIRKVLGASVRSLVTLLSKDFLQLTVIAIVIAFPLAWFFIDRWLRDFAYRITVGWDIFLLAGATILFIAMATISIQAIKAALSNPVKSLKSE